MTHPIRRKGPAPEPAGSGTLEARLGYTFQDRRLLEEALTHASTGKARDNQRLEFLGDAFVNLGATLLIHRLQPTWEEGPMSKLRGLLVCTDSLAEWARDLGLELRRGGQAKGRVAFGNKPMADALEALLAAVYLDATARGLDGLPLVADLVARRFEAAVRAAHPGLWEHRDAKTTLQERAATLGLAAPVYTLVDRSGPDHAPAFRVNVQVGAMIAVASGATLKKAEAEAARALLARISNEALPS
ncbi:MAG TPA: ribonuclease III domain-containing protein [Holophagaceae bacterium]|nr:ribonuclease III domain-containing protein [Holophagaceae bacterium]